MQKTRAKRLISALVSHSDGGGETGEDSFPPFSPKCPSARRHCGSQHLRSSLGECYRQQARRNQVGQNYPSETF